MRRIITRFGELMSRKELAIYAIYGSDNVHGGEKNMDLLADGDV